MFIDRVTRYLETGLLIVDIGAMIDRCAPLENRIKLAAAPKVSLVAFEPSEEERVYCEQYFAEQGINAYTLLPHIIADGSQRTFYESQCHLVSGLFPVDPFLVEVSTFPQNALEFKSLNKVQTKRLDDVPEARNVDFLKIDTEGAELLILENGLETLANAKVVELEVQFSPCQTGGALYWEVGQFMHEHGFLVHKVMPMQVLNFKPWDTPPGISHHHAGNLVFVKNLQMIDHYSVEDFIKTAVILQDVYFSSDLASFHLQKADQILGGNALFKEHAKFDY